MRNQLMIASVYANVAAHKAKKNVIVAKDRVVDSKREIAAVVATSAATYVFGHVTGFRAGYDFAKHS